MSKESMKLEMVDDEGENQAVRMFLALYGGACGVTVEQMRKHLKMAGFDGAWPEWANSNNGHLTKAGAQLWIRHLFALEQPAQQKPLIGETNVELGFYSNDASNGQQRELVGKVEMGQLVGNRSHESASNPDAKREIAVITGVDEYGPMLNWYTHWVNFPIGTKLYTSPPASKPLTDEQINKMRKELSPAHGQIFNSLQFARAIEAAHGITGETQ